MNKIWIIVKREYITRVRKRSFLITTLLAPLGFFLLMASSIIISTYSQSKSDVAIIDDSGLFKDIPIPDAEDQSVYFHKVGDKYDDLLKQMPQDKNKEGKYQVVIHIPQNFDINNPKKPKIYGVYSSRPGLNKRQFINSRLNDAVNKLRLKILHIDDETQARMAEKLSIDLNSLTNEQENKGYTEAAAIVGTVMGFAIYISLFFYGTMIMKGVMEEKTNRIVEVLTSSVKPFQLLAGKILGIGAVGLTQFVLWMILMTIVYMFGLPILGVSMGAHAPQMSQVNSADIDPDSVMAIVNNLHKLPLTQIAILFPLFFLGGFLLYGSLFAAVGAAMGEDGDQQSLMVPITVPIIVSIFIAINVINNPDSSLGLWGSLIPLTSPVVMSTLLPFSPPWWQVGLSIIFLIGGFVLTTWVAARIYRVGILMYGKKISFREMGKWIFSKG